MKCPRCKEKIKKDAFVCKYCKQDILPHSSHIIKSSIFNLFTSENRAKCLVYFNNDISYADKIATMEQLYEVMKKLGYNVYWGGNDQDDPELKFWFKGNNFENLAQVVAALGRQTKSLTDGEVKISGLVMENY